MSDDPVWAERRRRQPPFVAAVCEDARVTAAYRSERHEFRGPLDTFVQVVRLCVVTDAFFGQVLYRAKVRLVARGVPLLPHVLHRAIARSSQMFIGDPVVMAPGVHFPHGHVVIDGITEIETGVVIFPFVTVGLVAGDFFGPTIRRGAHVGTGAKVLGSVEVGPRAQIGANAVVRRDVPAEATAVGVPARVVERS